MYILIKKKKCCFFSGIEEEPELNDLDTESRISKSEDNKQGFDRDRCIQ